MPAVLYSFRRCPYAMRARMALSVSAADYEHREVLLRNKPQAMLDASPKGTVPVFITDNGHVIDESRAIMDWALGQNDPKGWLEYVGSDAETLITDNDGPFKIHLDRYKYASRYDDQARRGDTDRSEREKAESYIRTLETRLMETPYLSGPQQSLADIAIFPFIRQFAHTDKVWWDQAPYPQVRDWLSRHIESPLFLSVMTKYPLWGPASK